MLSFQIDLTHTEFFLTNFVSHIIIILSQRMLCYKKLKPFNISTFQRIKEQCHSIPHSVNEICLVFIIITTHHYNILLIVPLLFTRFSRTSMITRCKQTLGVIFPLSCLIQGLISRNNK